MHASVSSSHFFGVVPPWVPCGRSSLGCGGWVNERIRTQPLLILVQFADSSVDLRVVIEVVETLNRKETVEIIKSWWSQTPPATFIGLNYLY